MMLVLSDRAGRREIVGHAMMMRSVVAVSGRQRIGRGGGGRGRQGRRRSSRLRARWVGTIDAADIRG
jgi:hypothetical protein